MSFHKLQSGYCLCLTGAGNLKKKRNPSEINTLIRCLHDCVIVRFSNWSAVKYENETCINRAAQEWTQTQGFPHDLEEFRWSFAQGVNLSNPSCEILKALDGVSSRQSFVAAVHPARHKGEEQI